MLQVHHSSAAEAFEKVFYHQLLFSYSFWFGSVFFFLATVFFLGNTFIWPHATAYKEALGKAGLIMYTVASVLFSKIMVEGQFTKQHHLEAAQLTLKNALALISSGVAGPGFRDQLVASLRSHNIVLSRTSLDAVLNSTEPPIQNFIQLREWATALKPRTAAETDWVVATALLTDVGFLAMTVGFGGGCILWLPVFFAKGISAEVSKALDQSALVFIFIGFACFLFVSVRGYHRQFERIEHGR
jgi:hypothetical protein